MIIIEEHESRVKANLLTHEILFFCLIADGLFDYGSDLLIFWIGVPMRQIHVDFPTYSRAVMLRACHNIRACGEYPAVNVVIVRRWFWPQTKTEIIGRYMRNSGFAT